jgi:hypothetical protein
VHFARSKPGDLGVVQVLTRVVSESGEIVTCAMGGSNVSKDIPIFSGVILRQREPDPKQCVSGVESHTGTFDGVPTLILRTVGDPTLEISGNPGITSRRVYAATGVVERTAAR